MDYFHLPVDQADEPALTDAIAGEPAQALGNRPDARVGRKHLDHQIGSAANAVLHDRPPRLRHDEQIRLHDQGALGIEDDVERREPHLA